MRSAVVGLWAAAIATASAAGLDVTEGAPVPAELRIGYETVRLPGSETIGLLGTGYALALGSGLSAGPALYSAVAGGRGGFFVVGVDGAWQTERVGPWALRLGLYAGGGGGGGAPVGGGLMLRPHADLLLHFDSSLLGRGDAGLSWSQVAFPSGAIRSSQLGFVVGFETGFRAHREPRAEEWPDVPASSGQGTGLGFDRVQLLAGTYAPRGAGARARIGVVGARAETLVGRHGSVGIETNGAASGAAAGYAEVLATLGLETGTAGDAIRLGGRIELGAGGGGTVGTGGGLLVKSSLATAFRIAPATELAFEAGWARAPRAGFSAPFATLGLRWSLAHAPGGTADPPARYVFASGIETYMRVGRNDGRTRSLSNVTFALSRFVAEDIYLTGEVHSAAVGGAGGFSVGLIGAGYERAVGARTRIGAELSGGAAGGGGVGSGGGAVVQPMLFAAWTVSPSASLRIGAGEIAALHGSLRSPVIAARLDLAYDAGARH